MTILKYIDSVPLKDYIQKLCPIGQQILNDVISILDLPHKVNEKHTTYSITKKKLEAEFAKESQVSNIQLKRLTRNWKIQLAKDAESLIPYVEAIENLFIPLAIHNNKGGKDKMILDKFNEPSWNNPVVRIVDPAGRDIARRVSGDYSAHGLHSAITFALSSYHTSVPDYLKLLGKELKANTTKSVKEKYYSMYCFWTGEKQLGSNEGVVSTKSK